MRQVHFAYRPDGGEWTGGHQTYEVRAGAAGFSLTPAQSADDLATVSPARFETLSIGRGDAQRAIPRGEGRVEQDGHLALTRGEVIEHLYNGDDGVEQSFELARRPEGSGDLVVRVRVRGQEYAGETASGHHFTDLATGLGVRYGAATWVDARGQRVALAVAWTGEDLAITVPEAVIEGAAYPAVVDPTVGPEFGIDNPIQATVYANQLTPSITAGSTSFLVTWQDARIGMASIVAARVDASGTVLDPGGITLRNYGAPLEAPAAAFDGTNFLVVWRDYLRLSTTYQSRIADDCWRCAA